MSGHARRIAKATVAVWLADTMRRLRDLRLENDISLAELAAATGLHERYIARLCEGRRSPSIRTLISLSLAMGVSPAELFQ